jgi:hypothetical protein
MNANGKKLPKTGNVFPAAKSEPRQGNVGALGLTTFTGGVWGVCSPLAHRILPPIASLRPCDERGARQCMEPMQWALGGSSRREPILPCAPIR